MKVASVAAIGLLLGCTNEGYPIPTDEMVERFTELGEVPDCATMQWAIQVQRSQDFTQSARYVANDSCNADWEARLTAAGFETWIPHGERIKAGEPRVMVTPPQDGARVVSINTSRAVAGVDMHAPEEAND